MLLVPASVAPCPTGIKQPGARIAAYAPRVRTPAFVVLGLAIVGCGKDGPHLVAADAQHFDGTPGLSDAPPYECDAPMGSAQLAFTRGGATATFGRVHAGGTWLVGPVAPVASAPMTLVLLFTDADAIPGTTASCCASVGSGCCPLTGLLGSSGMGLPSGAETGDHALRFTSFQDPGVDLAGTVTITDFVQPFEHAPGHIAGTVSATAGADHLTGSFDNAFCAALLTATI